MLSRISAKRKKYYSMVNTYKQRREQLRKKFSITKICNPHYKLPDKYVEEANKYRLKIMVWNRQIKRLDILGDSIARLERAVYEFTDVKISNYPYMKVPDSVKLAKSLYYKFGLENRIPPIELRDYIGLTGNKQRDEPPIYRTRFTRSFETNPENKEAWMQFKKFYSELNKGENSPSKRRYGTIDPRRN